LTIKHKDEFSGKIPELNYNASIGEKRTTVSNGIIKAGVLKSRQGKRKKKSRLREYIAYGEPELRKTELR